MEKENLFSRIFYQTKVSKQMKYGRGKLGHVIKIQEIEKLKESYVYLFYKMLNREKGEKGFIRQIYKINGISCTYELCLYREYPRYRYFEKYKRCLIYNILKDWIIL